MESFKNFESLLLKNCSNLIFNKYGRHLGTPGSDAIYDRRDYIKYRLGAIFQQIAYLKLTAKSHANNYQTIKGDQGDEIDATIKAIEQVSYCLDNLIFNLASITDYVGNYLGLFIYGPKNQTKKWQGLVNLTNAQYTNHSFGILLAAEHNDWFTKLHSFRGDIIHRKVFLVEVKGYVNTRSNPIPVDSLEFIVNNALKKYFHIIRKEDEISVADCAHRFSERTISGLSKILKSAESIDIRASKS